MSRSITYGPMSRRFRHMSLAAGLIVGGLAVSAPSAGAAPARTPLPLACPSRATVATTLKERITKVASATTTTSRGTVKVCAYKTRYKTPTVIAFGTPVSHAKFTALRRMESRQARVVTVPGIGNEAWAVKRGGGLSFLKGTLDTGIAAPHTTDRELRALARTILRDLPRN